MNAYGPDGMLKPLYLKSIGVLSSAETQPEFIHHRQELLELVGQLSAADRERCRDYLRNGTLILAFMEQTTDVLHQAFTVPGGSGIRSDGVFYWRQDAADYVDAYGVGVDAEFIKHCERRAWRPLQLGPAEVSEVDSALAGQLGLRLRPPTERDVLAQKRKATSQPYWDRCRLWGALSSVESRRWSSPRSSRPYSFHRSWLRRTPPLS